MVSNLPIVHFQIKQKPIPCQPDSKNLALAPVTSVIIVKRVSAFNLMTIKMMKQGNL